MLQDAMLARQSAGRVRAVAAPKAGGLGALLEGPGGADGREAVQWAVLYSSTSALLGLRGQANYAAANAAMDGRARGAQAAGLPRASVQWGAGSGGGMAAGARIEALAAGRGATSRRSSSTTRRRARGFGVRACACRDHTRASAACESAR